ncbi:MAG: hypothetical protein Q9214_007160, partial [Letrouitia sp. 1 TL-2023]
MSGAEAVAILGIISSIVSIVDGAKQVYDAASNAESLPEAFREVATRLPIVQDILNSAGRYIEGGGADEDVCKGAKAVLKSCEVKVLKLKKLFEEVIPADGSSRMKKYLSAVKTLGKGSRVESLMKGVLMDVQLLAVEHGMVTETDQYGDQLAKAIREVADLPASLPGHAADDTGFTASHSGSGHIYQLQGEQFNNTGSRHTYHAQTMTFGSNEKDKAQACLSALFQTLGTDPRDDRNKITQRKGTRVIGTCTWITSHEIYESWLGSHSGLLYLSGGPGKGKTMLSILLTEEFERIAENSPDVVFLEYFCNNEDEKRRTADGIIRG